MHVRMAKMFKDGVELGRRLLSARYTPVYQFAQPCYTIAQVEEMLAISRSTGNRRIKDGVFKKFPLGANSVRIAADSLQAFLNDRMMGSQLGSYA